MKLVSTADSHYPNPDAWKDRELYKRLGWLGKSKAPEWLSSELPDGVEELGYELYPKNGDQMWESYKSYSQECKVEYDEYIQTLKNSLKLVKLNMIQKSLEMYIINETLEITKLCNRYKYKIIFKGFRCQFNMFTQFSN